MFENIGWIVEAKLKDGKRDEFAAVMKEIVAETQKEAGTLNYQYYISDEGDVMVYERFQDVESAHTHVTLQSAGSLPPSRHEWFIWVTCQKTYVHATQR